MGKYDHCRTSGKESVDREGLIRIYEYNNVRIKKKTKVEVRLHKEIRESPSFILTNIYPLAIATSDLASLWHYRHGAKSANCGTNVSNFAQKECFFINLIVYRWQLSTKCWKFKIPKMWLEVEKSCTRDLSLLGISWLLDTTLKHFVHALAQSLLKWSSYLLVALCQGPSLGASAWGSTG